MKAAFAIDLPSLNDFVFDTACALVSFEQQFRHDGLAFASVDDLVFVGDDPMIGLDGEERSVLIFPLRECSAVLESWWYRPNAVLDIGMPMQLLGPKGRMKKLAALIETRSF
jgi:hypothetical protein